MVTAPGRRVNCISFSPDGKMLADGSAAKAADQVNKGNQEEQHDSAQERERNYLISRTKRGTRVRAGRWFHHLSLNVGWLRLDRWHLGGVHDSFPRTG